jgi:vacuolar-type H+-ATPase subunit H
VIDAERHDAERHEDSKMLEIVNEVLLAEKRAAQIVQGARKEEAEIRGAAQQEADRILKRARERARQLIQKRGEAARQEAEKRLRTELERGRTRYKELEENLLKEEHRIVDKILRLLITPEHLKE